MPRCEPTRDLLVISILKALINGAFLTQDPHRIHLGLGLIHGGIPIMAVSYFCVGLSIDSIFNIFELFGCKELTILLSMTDLGISNLLDHIRG